MDENISTGERSRAPSLLRRAFATWRTSGMRDLWFKSLDATFYRRLFLLQRPLDEPIPEVRARIVLEIGLLARSEIPAYVALRPDATPAAIEARLDAGSWCFVARHEGRIVCARWAGRGRLPIDHLDTELPLAPDEACSFDLFTAPEQRGNGVSPAASAEMLRFLRAAGYRRVIVAITPENRASLRSVEKTGYRRFGVIGYVRLGSWRWRFCRLDATPRT